MKRFLRSYLPSSAIAFTAVILFNVFYNMLLGFHGSISSAFILQLTGLIAFIQLLSLVLDHIHFRSRTAYTITFYTVEYAAVLAASFLLNWVDITITNFLYTTLLCAFIALVIDRYFHAVYQHEADEINRLLHENEGA